MTSCNDLQAGVARRIINPDPGVGVDLMGYYLERTWKTVHDDLNATAVEAMCRFQVEWTDRLTDQHERPLTLDTEVQAIRFGDLTTVTNVTEFFTTLTLDVRSRSTSEHLMIAAYSSGCIGYWPDAHDVRNRSYAAYRSLNTVPNCRSLNRQEG